MAKLILYDGMLGNTPDRQGWLAYGTIFPLISFQKAASETNINRQTVRYSNLKTSIRAEALSGYSNYQSGSAKLVNNTFPSLNRSQGFNLSFQLRINSETHSTNDRAGFSVTLLGSDKFGIELGFWTNEIWAQQGNGSTLFTHSSSEKAFLSTTQWVRYDLLILDNNYFLSANGKVVLRGSTKSYWDNVASGMPYDPYEQANFLFLGDNTSRASASADLASVAINAADFKTTGNDAVQGGSDDDVINGQGGSDRLNGAGGHDVLIGGNGDDWLNGGSGHDRLIGQGGRDHFLFDSGAAFSAANFGIDVVMDFTRSDNDRLVLDKTSFTALKSPAGHSLSAAEFASVAGASAAALSPALIVYDSLSGALYYNQNRTLSGFGSGDQFATLLGNPGLMASQFLVQA